MNILKRIYHVLLKRDIKSIFYTNRFGSFGNKSIFYKPLNIMDKKNIFIGNNTTILNNSRLQVFNKLTGLNSKITIGNNCYIGYNVSILAGENVILEDGVLLASNILISSENHGINPESDKYYSDQKLDCKSVKIKEGAWIGERVCILPGITIGKKSVIGAGSVVTKDVPDFCIAVGNPARVIKKYDFEKKEWISEGKI